MVPRLSCGVSMDGVHGPLQSPSTNGVFTRRMSSTAGKCKLVFLFKSKVKFSCDVNQEFMHRIPRRQFAIFLTPWIFTFR